MEIGANGEVGPAVLKLVEAVVWKKEQEDAIIQVQLMVATIAQGQVVPLKTATHIPVQVDNFFPFKIFIKNF